MSTTITRALRFEVTFPGWRQADLKGRKGCSYNDGKGLYKELWDASNDLTRAANRLMGALYHNKIGTIPWPLKGDGTKVSDRTLSYQGLSGKWQPTGQPLYNPRGRRSSGQVLLEVASLVHSRLKTDFVDVQQGKRTLSTFRSLPISVNNQSVQLQDNGDVTLKLWAGTKNNRLTVRARKLDKGQRAILRRCIAGQKLRAEADKKIKAADKSGDKAALAKAKADKKAIAEHKHGHAKLMWVQPEGRKGKWVLSLSWTGQVDSKAEGKLVAGVHLGMTTTVSVAYTDLAKGTVQRFKDLHQIPESAWRSWKRLDREKKQRLETNKDSYHRRTGRGRQRKLRVLRVIGGRHQHVTDSSLSMVAASVVARAIQRGATVIALEDLTSWSRDRAMDELTEGTNRQRAEHRKWYFRWHQGQLRQAIKSAAEREGLTVIEVDATLDSRTCCHCDARYPEPRKGDDGMLYGRVKWREFRCGECKHKDKVKKRVCNTGPGRKWKTVYEMKWPHADRNAAINVARRGYQMHLEAQAAK